MLATNKLLSAAAALLLAAAATFGTPCSGAASPKPVKGRCERRRACVRGGAAAGGPQPRASRRGHVRSAGRVRLLSPGHQPTTVAVRRTDRGRRPALAPPASRSSP